MEKETKKWALILGASSGFGAATAIELSKNGYNIFGVHLDRAATMPNVEKVIEQIKGNGVEVEFFNVNAADHEKRKEVLDAIEKRFANEPSIIKVVLHSLAFGTLRPYIAENPEEQVTPKQMDMTLDVMAHSLVYWVQDLFHRKLIGKGTRIFAMTSEGSTRVWAYYGPVSAAKAALESHIRQLAYELAKYGITVNGIRAGVTDTPALRKIPGNEQMIEYSLKRNPSGRLTTPEDVAKAIVHLSHDDMQWVTGNIIGVDGGEFIAG
ncbi:Enoyl-[acyl-carrier-protein] reductase [NADH] [Candidatus Kryptonium thompsonii]|uniref:Enoyl-[acyl-carrier-protein] reductase [NADH] n=1 Tax=Candidatus Kryptonium thompsonii TaxID=1633631 RepID=A0A0N7MT47_9BACT|nr:SDR family oxidoreductase [Candidatus Kryptonium thompsoni]CUS78330.1 Enoyl-[acyl-carrier-protein] reductase [NADH] [Candidatus Kryptonium thompsoni]CUS78410.1 Enoyl-[acyl-carrier-protein] reductase [NADH] [Candidatus Kryptonium thompsoni]CUS79076.1 Enoyl-[acyl-carrier-protein] reductase [NADH] [Candidatus Kryptonium thompsoni]CUS79882.1 Enoyl-[acyl-carrier-protein] reductase [NADH] [Candidatus Kryptonium thompsoni]CUS88563.1 Enoyl-[acyl-carrier-protein] reductase [NADH] [Candidatus Krypton